MKKKKNNIIKYPKISKIKRNKKIPRKSSQKIPKNPKNSLKKIKGQNFLKNPKFFLKNQKTPKQHSFLKICKF